VKPPWVSQENKMTGAFQKMERLVVFHFPKCPEFLCLVSVPPNTSQILLVAFTIYAQESTECLKPLSSTELVNLGHFRKMAAMQQGLEGPLWEREGKIRKPEKGQRGKVNDDDDEK
jgi:hypothetical protein